MMRRIHLTETASTNTYARSCNGEESPLLITTDYQTAGRGQRGNTWEAEAGKNLLLSLVIRPQGIAITQQFALSQHVSAALCKALGRYTDGIRIKWPNDIYWHDKKIAGILIEHDIEGDKLTRSIIGIGLNVNQVHFTSDAPNPVSLCQILGHDVDREELLATLCHEILQPCTEDGTEELHHRYTALLYRLREPALYRDAEGTFTAQIHHVEPDGHLILEDTGGRRRSYLFKEVTYVI